MKGKERKIAERQRERVCERQSAAERGGSVSCITGRWRNVMGEIRIGLRGQDYMKGLHRSRNNFNGLSYI